MQSAFQKITQNAVRLLRRNSMGETNKEERRIQNENADECEDPARAVQHAR
jgi:hypothetical protein